MMPIHPASVPASRVAGAVAAALALAAFAPPAPAAPAQVRFVEGFRDVSTFYGTATSDLNFFNQVPSTGEDGRQSTADAGVFDQRAAVSYEQPRVFSDVDEEDSFYSYKVDGGASIRQQSTIGGDGIAARFVGEVVEDSFYSGRFDFLSNGPGAIAVNVRARSQIISRFVLDAPATYVLSPFDGFDPGSPDPVTLPGVTRDEDSLSLTDPDGDPLYDSPITGSTLRLDTSLLRLDGGSTGTVVAGAAIRYFTGTDDDPGVEFTRDGTFVGVLSPGTYLLQSLFEGEVSGGGDDFTFDLGPTLALSDAAGAAVVPLPAGAWGGAATLGGLALVGAARRRREATA